MKYVSWIWCWIPGVWSGCWRGAKGFIRWSWDCFYGEPDFFKHPDYVKAETWCEEFTVQEDEKSGYDWVQDQAKTAYQQSFNIYGKLDEKAEGLFRQIGGGGGLIALGTVTLILREPKLLDPLQWLFPSIVMAVVAGYLALRARKPVTMGAISGVPNAVGWVKSKGDLSSIYYLQEWYLATVLLDLQIERKSKFVTWSYRFYIGAFIGLFFPVIYILFIR